VELGKIVGKKIISLEGKEERDDRVEHLALDILLNTED
jgi:hypothetical protein